MASLFGFCDESGKESGSRAFILITVTFEIEHIPKFEDRVWRWKADPDNPPGREIKLRKILERAGYAQGKLDAWRAILGDSGFRWFATLIPANSAYSLNGRTTTRDTLAAAVSLNRFSTLLENHGALGNITLDHQIAEETLPELAHDAKFLGRSPIDGKESVAYRRLVGQISHAHSHLVPELWIADGIAYLLHRQLNQRRWRTAFDEIWRVIKERVWLSPEGLLTGWGLDVYPTDETLEAEATEFITL